MEISSSQLDKILAMQFTIAWAGEGLSDPRRLDWWKTDLIDEDGGGDLLKRLCPQTHQWVSLEAARKAAIQVDRQKHTAMAQPDQLRSLFFWGFEVDEKLQERILWHKHRLKPPGAVLPVPIDIISKNFNRDSLAYALQVEAEKPTYRLGPGGREILNKLTDNPVRIAQLLGATLIPFSDDYPSPFYRLEG